MTDLEKLLALEEIRALKGRYCRFLDTKKWDDWAQVFAEDCTMDTSEDVTEEVTAATGAPPKIIGRNVIVPQVRDLVGRCRTVHQVHAPEIEFVSDALAKGIWAMEDWVTFPDDGQPAPFKSLHGYGHYYETYERIGGRWYIKSLKLTRLQQDFT